MSQVHERKRLPDTRNSKTHKVKITAGTSGDEYTLFIIVGEYEDGSAGELFINMGKAGSTLNGLLDSIGILCSYALQYGVPLDVLASRMQDISFEPMGQTSNPEIPTCLSIVDYIFRWIGLTYGQGSSADTDQDKDEHGGQD